MQFLKDLFSSEQQDYRKAKNSYDKWLGKLEEISDENLQKVEEYDSLKRKLEERSIEENLPKIKKEIQESFKKEYETELTSLAENRQNNFNHFLSNLPIEAAKLYAHPQFQQALKELLKEGIVLNVTQVRNKIAENQEFENWEQKKQTAHAKYMKQLTMLQGESSQSLLAKTKENFEKGHHMNSLYSTGLDAFLTKNPVLPSKIRETMAEKIAISDMPISLKLREKMAQSFFGSFYRGQAGIKIAIENMKSKDKPMGLSSWNAFLVVLSFIFLGSKAGMNTYFKVSQQSSTNKEQDISKQQDKRDEYSISLSINKVLTEQAKVTTPKEYRDMLPTSDSDTHSSQSSHVDSTVKASLKTETNISSATTAISSTFTAAEQSQPSSITSTSSLTR